MGVTVDRALERTYRTEKQANKTSCEGVRKTEMYADIMTQSHMTMPHRSSPTPVSLIRKYVSAVAPQKRFRQHFRERLPFACRHDESSIY